MNMPYRILLTSIAKYLLVVFAISAMFCHEAHGNRQEDDGKWISLLRDFANELQWSTGIFVSNLEDHQSRIYGISDKSFTNINQENEKRLVQLIIGPEENLKALFQIHRKNLLEAQFKVINLSGDGLQAFRGYCPYYVLKKDVFVLQKSTDLVEILYGNMLLTLREERMDLYTHIHVMFEQFVDFASRKSLMDEQLRKAKLPDMKDMFSSLARKISIENLFPDASQLPWGIENWNIAPASDNIGYFTQSYGEKVVYEYTGEMKRSAKPIIEVLVYGFERRKMADAMLKSIKDALVKGDVYISHDRLFGESCLLLIHDKVDLNRIIFVRGIFLCEIRVLWKASLQEDRDALLRVFAEYMDNILRLRWDEISKTQK